MIALVVLYCVFIARGLDKLDETKVDDQMMVPSIDMNLVTPKYVPPESSKTFILIANTAIYNNTIEPMGEVVDADGTPIQNPQNGDILVHNMRVLQQKIEKYERMYDFFVKYFVVTRDAHEFSLFGNVMNKD